MAAPFVDALFNRYCGINDPRVNPVIVESKMRLSYSTGNICNILDETVHQSRFIVVDHGCMRQLIPARRSSDSRLYSTLDLGSLSLPSSGQVTFRSRGFGWHGSADTNISGCPEDVFDSDHDGIYMLVSPHQSDAAIKARTQNNSVLYIQKTADAYASLADELQGLNINRSSAVGDLQGTSQSLIATVISNACQHVLKMSAPLMAVDGALHSSSNNAEIAGSSEIVTNKCEETELAAISFIDDSDAE